MEDDKLYNMGRRIAEIRKANKITQESLSEILDITPKHVSHVENGTSSLSLKNLIKFCEYFNCSMDYIISGHNNSPILDKLPDDITAILQTGSPEEIDTLNRYLAIYSKIKDFYRNKF